MVQKLDKKICILCKKRKTKDKLFCDICKEEDTFVRLKAFKESKFFKKGWFASSKLNYGRLPTREEREREI